MLCKRFRLRKEDKAEAKTKKRPLRLVLLELQLGAVRRRWVTASVLLLIIVIVEFQLYSKWEIDRM